MWLLIISAIVFPMMVYFMTKRVAKWELYATTGMATYVQLLTDVYLHVKLNWYGYFSESNRTEWITVFLTPLYLSINPLFLNFYPYDQGKRKEALYILGWSVFSVLYEYAAVEAGMFYHNEWKLYHSAITYPFLFVLLRLQLAFVRKLKRDAEGV